VSSNLADKAITDIDDLAVAALVESWVAVAAFPEAWPIAEFIYDKQCKPSEVIKAGETWLEMAGVLADATDRIGARTDRFSASAWTGRDREAFDEHLSDYTGELYFDQAAALVIGGVMVAVGALLALLLICCFVVATILVIMAAPSTASPRLVAC
jgi:hypothetical protein